MSNVNLTYASLNFKGRHFHKIKPGKICILKTTLMAYKDTNIANNLNKKYIQAESFQNYLNLPNKLFKWLKNMKFPLIIVKSWIDQIALGWLPMSIIGGYRIQIVLTQTQIKIIRINYLIQEQLPITKILF